MDEWQEEGYLKRSTEKANQEKKLSRSKCLQKKKNSGGVKHKGHWREKAKGFL